MRDKYFLSNIETKHTGFRVNSIQIPKRYITIWNVMSRSIKETAYAKIMPRLISLPKCLKEVKVRAIMYDSRHIQWLSHLTEFTLPQT